MNTRLIKSIPQLAKAGLNTQAIDLINVVKASFDIPQEYKDHVNVLPPHFVEMMYNLFRDACYEACDAGFKCVDKAMTLQKIEMTFSDKAQKALEVLSDTAGLLNSLKQAIDVCFECGLKEGGHQSVLEKSIEDKAPEVVAGHEEDLSDDDGFNMQYSNDTVTLDVIEGFGEVIVGLDTADFDIEVKIPGKSVTSMSKLFEKMKTFADEVKSHKPWTKRDIQAAMSDYIKNKALANNPVDTVTASIENDAIQNMIKYVNSLNNANRTALVYALGILKYVDEGALKRGVVQKATASAPIEEVVVPNVPVVEEEMGHDLVALPTEEKIEEMANETVKNNSMIGIFSIPVLFKRVESIMKSHQFSSDTEVECVVVDTLVDNISNLTIDDVCQIASDKLCVDCSQCNSIEHLLDCLDNQADEINMLLGIPATLIFLVKDNALTLSACFSKFDVVKMLESNPSNVTQVVTQVVGSNGRTQSPISVSEKKEIECLARMKSLSGVKMKDLKKGAPRMAQYVSALVADFRTGKICAWSMAKSIRKCMADLVENCYGVDAKLYYEHLNENKTKASVEIKDLAGYIYSDCEAMTVITILQDYLNSLNDEKLNEIIEQVGYGA